MCASRSDLPENIENSLLFETFGVIIQLIRSRPLLLIKGASFAL